MSKQLTTVGNWSIEDIQTMKQTLAAETTDSQFQLFIRTAHASGLNPFLNHIYAICYKGTMSLQIGIEGIAYLAKQKEGFQGYDAQVVYEGEPFKATRNKDGIWEIEHEPDVFAPDDAQIRGAYAVAYRDGFKPYTVIMKFSEVEHFLKSPIPNQQTMWKKYTADMFKKHVLKRALKGQFGIDINEDDFSVNNPEPYEQPTRRDITEEANAASRGNEPFAEGMRHAQERFGPKDGAKASPQNQTPDPEPQPQDDESAKIETLRKQMNVKFRELGITGKDAKAEYIASKNVVKGDVPTLQELTKLIKLMDVDIAKKQAQASDDDDLLGGDPQ